MSQLTPILLIAHHFPPENIIGSLRPARFFRYLPEFGYEPYVLTASPQKQTDPRIAVSPYNRAGIAARILGRTVAPCDDKPVWALTARQAGAELIARGKCRLILATSPPYSVHSLAFHLARQAGIPWVADVRDPLSGNAGRPAGGMLGWIDEQVEKRILTAGRVILNTEAALAHWRGKYPARQDRFDFLYNGFDPANLPEPAGPLPPRERRILLHAGSLYNVEYAALLLAALRGLIAAGRLRPEQFHLQFIGSVPDELAQLPDFQYLAARGAVESTGEHIPQDQARRRMQESDSLILLDYYRPDGSLQLPAKLFDYLPIGRPLLAVTTPGAPMHRTLELSGIPHVALLPSDTPDQAMDKVERLLSIPAGPHPLSAAYREQFDGRNQTKTLAGILDRALQDHPA